jgi:hypothetical protein
MVLKSKKENDEFFILLIICSTERSEPMCDVKRSIIYFVCLFIKFIMSVCKFRSAQLIFILSISLIEQVLCQLVVDHKSSIRKFLLVIIVASGGVSKCKGIYQYKNRGVDMRKEQQIDRKIFLFIFTFQYTIRSDYFSACRLIIGFFLLYSPKVINRS